MSFTIPGYDVWKLSGPPDTTEDWERYCDKYLEVEYLEAAADYVDVYDPIMKADIETGIIAERVLPDTSDTEKLLDQLADWGIITSWDNFCNDYRYD